MREPADVAASIADNVRRWRLQRAMTLEALAERADVSRGTLVQVEQRRGNPSIATLCRIADALGVGVASLVEAPPAPRVTVRRSAQAPVLWTSQAGSRALFLVGTDPPEIVELWDWYLAPGDAFDGEAHAPGTLEMLTVLAGTALIRVGTGEHRLDEGDSILFEADVAHRYANAGEGECRFIMSVLQPSGRPLGTPDTIAPAGS